MTDYRLEAKIRNARFLRALEGIGESPSGFAKRKGLNVSRMSAIAAMRIAPLNAKGDWWPEVMALCDAANVMPCDLFTDKQMEGLETTTSSQDVSEDQIEYQAANMEALLLSARPPERRTVETDVAVSLLALLRETHPRNARAVALHQEGATYQEIGAEIGFTTERARQMVAKGYRIMRERANKRMGIASYAELEATQ